MLMNVNCYSTPTSVHTEIIYKKGEENNSVGNWTLQVNHKR